MLIQNTYIRVFGVALLASVSRFIKKPLPILVFLHFFRKNSISTWRFFFNRESSSTVLSGTEKYSNVGHRYLYLIYMWGDPKNWFPDYAWFYKFLNWSFVGCNQKLFIDIILQDMTWGLINHRFFTKRLSIIFFLIQINASRKPCFPAFHRKKSRGNFRLRYYTLRLFVP